MSSAAAPSSTSSQGSDGTIGGIGKNGFPTAVQFAIPIIIVGVIAAMVSLVLYWRCTGRLRALPTHPLPGAKPPRPIGEKPRIWDVWVGSGSSHEPSAASNTWEWNQIQPLAVCEQLSEKPAEPSQPESQPQRQPLWKQPLQKLRPHDTSEPDSSAPEVRNLQVGVIVSMPDPRRPATRSEPGSSSSPVDETTREYMIGFKDVTV